MKRLALLAGALVTSSAALAADETEIKHNGDFRVRYFNDMVPSGIKDSPQNVSDIEARTRLGLTMKRGEKFHAHLGFLHNAKFGADKGNVATVAETPGQTGTQGYASVNDRNSLLVNQAYGGWMATDSLTFKVGRFNVELGDGEFFSADDWNAVPITHEGLHAAIDTDFAAFNAFLIQDKQLANGNPDSDPEQHNVIVHGALKNMPEVLKTVELTAVQISRSETATPAAGAANAQHIGLVVGGETNGLFYKGVYATQMGVLSKTATTETKLEGNMFDLTVGYMMPDVMGLKLSANYHSDSGDDSADNTTKRYQPLYYNTHRYAGMMDIFGWGNLTYWNLNASIMPMEDLTVGLGIYGFSKTVERDNNGINGTGLSRFGRGGAANTFLNGAANDKSDLGMEIDLYARKTYGDTFAIDAMLGMFTPGAAFKDATPKRDNNIMQLMIAGTMTF